MQNHFTFTRPQRLGLIFLFSIIIALQLLIVFSEFSPQQLRHDQSWLALQPKIDSMKAAKLEQRYKPRHYPFNPNFITDYRGHVLGMSVAEIDRLHAFRAENKFVNSAQEFQEVTKISDSLLTAISPYFKFPDWVTRRNKASKFPSKPAVRAKIDINSATKDDLMKVYGIGDKLSDRILEQKTKLGVFVSMEQMADVWGLSPEVVSKLNDSFLVSGNPVPTKINVNSATLKELAQFPYFRYGTAKKIITWRSMNGIIKNIDDLSKVEGIPLEKLHIIAVYLKF